jgi:hypothetical protein
MGRWAAKLRAEGVELAVYDPRSLLAAVVPTFRR